MIVHEFQLKGRKAKLCSLMLQNSRNLLSWAGLLIARAEPDASLDFYYMSDIYYGR